MKCSLESVPFTETTAQNWQTIDDIFAWELWCVFVKVVRSCLTLCNLMGCSLPGSFVHGDFPGKNTRLACHFLFQGIVPTQGLNPGLLHCRQILYNLSHQESPRILEWVSYPFSSRSSSPRNRTRVSRTAGRFFTNWAMREALLPLGSWTLLIQDLIKKKK